LPEFLGSGKPVDKGVGLKFSDGKGNHIRISKANPEANFPSQKVDYVKITKDGKVIGIDGKPILEVENGLTPSQNPRSHIPLNEWIKSWKSGFQK
jgi:hypothetical protein